jgi:hypothetical protein
MFTFEDHLAIQNLIAAYFIATDNADADAFMSTWVSPEEFGGYYSEAFGDLPTWQSMYDYEKHHVGPGSMANGKRHQVTNVHVQPVSPTEVHVTHDMIVLEVVLDSKHAQLVEIAREALSILQEQPTSGEG